MAPLLALLVIGFGWVGHACIWTALLNNLYGRPLNKGLLRLWRMATAFILLLYPVMIWSAWTPEVHSPSGGESGRGVWFYTVLIYAQICFLLGAVGFPIITLARLLRTRPLCLIAEETRTMDLWPVLGKKLIGDHKLAALTRLPGNGVFQIDITDLTLSLTEMPAAWNGLTLLVLSDMHFHGTPSRVFFDRLLEELQSGPSADLVCLIGDYIDSDTHFDWIEPILGRLAAREAKLAILGNHDLLHHPEQIRAELTRAGYRVLGNSWMEFTIRGVPCVAVGHEGPWFLPAPDLAAAPKKSFRLCLSHTPDNFYWACANRVQLMLCGHVHGGAIRVPLIGSIFVPSVFGRRFDAGLFEHQGTTMVVGRGLSGKEPLRFRCNPQVIRITLRHNHDLESGS